MGYERSNTCRSAHFYGLSNHIHRKFVEKFCKNQKYPLVLKVEWYYNKYQNESGANMICYKNSFATEAVRRYLLQLIAKSGPEPERLPPERELAERLHLSRVTVRRAIEELENMSYILRLPGRKGAFTNPAVASEVEHTIGIVVYQNYVGQIFSQFLSGLSGELYRCGHHYNFSLFQRSGSSASQVAFELENSGYDCIVWHTQAPEDLEVIRLLHLHKFPVFTLCNPNFPEWGMAPGQNYGLDMQQAGEAQAAFLLKKQCRKPVLCCSGGVSAMTGAFQRKLAENGVSAGAENFFCSAGSFLDCLDVLLEKGMDGICCSLGEPQILALLEKHKDKAVFVFTSRAQADAFLQECE